MKSERTIETIECWRKYFREANVDIFGVIHHAIMVASSDYPKEFRFRRDRIAELLFSCRLTRCSACDRLELVTPPHAHDHGNRNTHDNILEADDDDVDVVDIQDQGGVAGVSSRGRESSKTNTSTNTNINTGDNLRISDPHDFSNQDLDFFLNHNNPLDSNYSFGEAEALTDEIEEASLVVREVLRIKDLLLNYPDEPDSLLYESLRRLQLMALTVDALKATEIGKAVNGLRKHGSKQIQDLARTLIEEWKVLVDEWYYTTKSIGEHVANEGTPDSTNPSVLDEEEGLPSPPLDEGAFFATQPTSIELSRFFDGMDDDGRNVVADTRNSGESIKNYGNTGKSSSGNGNTRKQNKPTQNEANTLPKDNRGQEMKRQGTLVKPMITSTSNSGPRRPSEQSHEQKIKESKLHQNKHKITRQREPLICQEKCSDEVAVQTKLEATKRKLQESYQQVENAKKQRTIQIMELHDLPKPASACRNPNMRSGNHRKQWAHGRRMNG